MELRAATPDDRPAVLNLCEFYTYDFSELLGLDVGDGGRFGDQHFTRHFEDPACQPFVLRVDGRLAGFALYEGRSRLTGEAGVHDVAEFFVMRKYRRSGLGARAAFALFDRFAGPWEVRQVAANPGATAFWRKVIDRYTAGRFEELAWDDARFRGVVQRFQSEGAVR